MACLKSPCWGRGNETTCPVGHPHFGLTCWSRPVRKNFPSWTSWLLQSTVPTGKLGSVPGSRCFCLASEEELSAEAASRSELPHPREACALGGDDLSVRVPQR